MRKLTIGARLALGFAAVLLVVCTVSIAGCIVMERTRKADARIASAYVPEMRLATAFEREILNARIFFIYHVTIQKPGALEKGWTRYGNARRLLPSLIEMRKHPELHELRRETEMLVADMDSYEVELKSILERVASGDTHGDAYMAAVTRWAALGTRLVDTAAELERKSSAVADANCTQLERELRVTVAATVAGCIAAILLGVM